MSTARVLRNQYVVASLKDRRSLLAGELRQLESQARLKAEALAHLDAVLSMYAPEIDAKALPVRVQRPNHPWRVIGLSRRIRGVLRRHGAVMASSEVVDAIMAEMGFPSEAHRVVAHAVRYALRNLAISDPSVVKEGERAEARWSLA